MAGRLELILGCMFSGKSSEIIRRIRNHRVIGRKILIINHSSDIRYISTDENREHAVISHNKDTESAVPLTELKHMFELDDYRTSEIIFIEEAQFFPDLYETVYRAVNEDHKYLVVAGLDGDFRCQPFETIRLVPIADQVDKLTAFCVTCRNGTPAIFSKRIDTRDTTREVVGGSDKYIPVCRAHMHT